MIDFSILFEIKPEHRINVPHVIWMFHRVCTLSLSQLPPPSSPAATAETSRADKAAQSCSVTVSFQPHGQGTGKDHVPLAADDVAAQGEIPCALGAGHDSRPLSAMLDAPIDTLFKMSAFGGQEGHGVAFLAACLSCRARRFCSFLCAAISASVASLKKGIVLNVGVAEYTNLSVTALQTQG